MINKCLTGIIGILLITACGKTDKPSTVSEIYLVRHFEKQIATAQSGKDVSLSPQGRANAKRLQTHLKNKNIGSIFSTDYKRTKQTAAPLSELFNTPTQIYNPSALDVFSARLLTSNKNQLVVGHSNTTGKLFGLLGCDPVVLSENDYGDIMVVKRIHTAAKTNIVECSRYQLTERMSVTDNLVFVKQADLHQYFTQTSAAFTITNLLENEPLKNGIIEVGFIIDAQGNTSNFEVVKSVPKGIWQAQALNAAHQLRFSPKENKVEADESVYTTWVFEFTAN